LNDSSDQANGHDQQNQNQAVLVFRAHYYSGLPIHKIDSVIMRSALVRCMSEK
jgi:hypothetical protein